MWNVPIHQHPIHAKLVLFLTGSFLRTYCDSIPNPLEPGTQSLGVPVAWRRRYGSRSRSRFATAHMHIVEYIKGIVKKMFLAVTLFICLAHPLEEKLSCTPFRLQDPQKY
ncbi:hypothetical protein BDZ94DRAFT_411692 [Collybia nuda]|uniref:Uncharacterized protein n=1 Tax=Collybia nuda TaxID=64659 RepID=A0A9P6CKA3_9AGAR|nr:hypothetical protein BDZ94DRAFT_411692 [Collybia nuda]